MYISQKIEERCLNHQGASSIVGEYLLKEKRNIRNYSLQQIADATFTSPATLVRIAKKLGYSGWNSFSKAYCDECLYMEKRDHQTDPDKPFSQKDRPIIIAEKISELMQESLRGTKEILDEAELEAAVKILDESDHILLMGMAPHAYLCELFEREMLTIGKRVSVCQLQGNYHYDVASLGEHDCIIMISYSGNNEKRFPMSFLPMIKQQGTRLIAITSEGDNLLRKEADCTLTILSRERIYSKIATFSTEISVYYLLNALFSCYFALDYDANLEYKIGVSKQREQTRNTVLKDIVET